MKYTDTQLRQEIDALLDELQAAGQPLTPAWVTHKVCKAHRAALREELGVREHVAFWEFAGYTVARKIATTCINGRDGGVVALADGEGTRQQIPLPGFARVYVNDYYVVRRNGEDVGISILELTDREIQERAALFRSQSVTMAAHAGELDRFLVWRASRLSAAVTA